MSFVSGIMSLNAQCVDNGNYWNNSWTSCQTSPNPNTVHDNSFWLLYEFHEPHSIDSTHIWNANRVGETESGINQVIVEYVIDSSESWNLLDTFNFPQADGLSTYEGFVGPSFDSLSVSKILFTVISTHENTMNCVSLAEVQFQTVCTNVWYEDVDGDGLGDPNSTLIDCNAPDNYVYNNVDTCDAMSWLDVYSIFDQSKCTDCHGNSGGLDLSTYDSFLQGGNSCNLLGGSTLVNIIKLGSSCDMSSFDAMNSYTSLPISDEQLEMIQLWIDGGAKEYCSDYCSDPEIAYNGIDDDCDPSTLDDDLDQDGFALADDCDDTDASINSIQEELIYNGIDDDCDPSTLDDDLDQDGFALADDCDDNNFNINASQEEVVYNGIDDDCDPDTLDDDLDQDGFVLADDCDDNNPNINANQVEVVYNGIDDDCDPSTLDDDLDQDGFVLADDCDDNNPNINSSQEEVVYNGIDDDCDASTLDDDLDQDGFVLADDCDDNNPNVNTNQDEVVYNGIDDDCDASTLDDDLDQDGFVLADDCDDDNASINSSQEEVVYNGIDDDCDPDTLDDDLDQDGFNSEDDCDDENSDINPIADEIPNNEIDEDCDGEDLVTSTHDLADVSINVFPNPTMDIINIEIVGNLNYSASLFELNGKLIKYADNPNFIDVNNLQQGTYLLEIKDEISSQKVVVKIVKVN